VARESNIEVKVGALIVVCGALLIAFLFLLGDFNMGESAHLTVDWPTSGGLKEGALVKLAGMKAGRVESVEFFGGKVDEKLGRPVYVRVVMSIKPELRETLRQDAKFYITTVGLLGEKYVEIDPGASTEVMAEDAITEGVPPMRIEVLSESIQSTLARTSRILARNEEKLTQAITDASAMVATSRAAVEDGRVFVTEARETLKTFKERGLTVIGKAESAIGAAETAITEYTPGSGETGGHIKTIMKRGANLATTFDKTVGDGRQIKGAITDARALTNRARQVIDKVGSKAIRVAGKAEGLMDTAGVVMGDGKVEVLAVLKQVRSIMATVGTMLNKIRDGKGSIGAMLNDREMYDDARELMKDLKRHPWKFLWKE